MRFKVTLDEADSPEVEIDRGTWLGRNKVYVNGNEVERLTENDRPFAIPMTDGAVRKMVVKNSLFGFDPVPQVIFDGREIRLARKLQTYEIVLAFLPLMLLLIGGGLGGLIGAMAAGYNFHILRSNRSATGQLISVLGVGLLSMVSYLIVAGIFVTLVGG